MKRLLLLLFLITFHWATFAQLNPWRTSEMEVKIKFRNAGDKSLLASLKLNCDIHRSSALAYVIPSELERIKQLGMEFEVLKSDLNKWSASFGTFLVPPGYYTFGQIQDIADSLSSHFPEICQKVIFGYNPQMQELAALKISDNVSVDEAEPEVLFDGGIHGDEVGGSQNVIQFARDLCLGYGSNLQITSLINSREIWLYYCVNPYGRDNMTRYNSATVDINRDYGYMWGAGGGSTGPFSQPETRALRDCQYSNQFVVNTSYHSGSEIISYPWSYRFSPVPDEPSIENLAQLYSINSGYPGLSWGQGSVEMYLIEGSTKDYNYGSLGSVAWSLEISNEKQPANAQYYYNLNKPAMLALIEHAGYGIQGTITDVVTGKQVSAAIYNGNNYPVYSDPLAGDYHKYLVPGTYTIEVVANGYEPQIVHNVIVQSQECTTINLQLNPLASQYAYKVTTTHIPGFNAQDPGDEGYTAACLGAPDNMNYSLGCGGYIIVDMQETIYDEEPEIDDFKVYEGDFSQEGYSVFAGATMDGPWISLGSATGTSSFDFHDFGIHAARFFKLLDDNDGNPNADNAGFDLDAIACLHPAIPDTLGHLTGYVFDAFAQLPIQGVTIQSGDSAVLTDESGKYSIELIRGVKSICALMDGYGSDCETFNVLAGEVSTLNFNLFPTNGVSLPADASEQLKVIPNPFSINFELELFMPEAGTGKIELFDFSGRSVSLVSEVHFSSGLNRINGEEIVGDYLSLNPGGYLLIIQAPDLVIRRKIFRIY